MQWQDNFLKKLQIKIKGRINALYTKALFFPFFI